MKELVCIVCPNSCKLTVADDGTVTGARCPRGKKFAEEETTCPKRTVCTTVATVFSDCPVLPVRTESEVPKDKIPEIMNIINGFLLEKRVGRGEIIVINVADTGVDLISTSSMLYNYYEKNQQR